MAKSVNPIILGGGISAGSPFTLGALTRVTNVTPPTIADSVVFQRTQTLIEVITIGTNSWPAATEKVQIVGGLISDTGAHGNFIAGQSAAAPAVANSNCIVIGKNASSFPTGNASFNNTVIGANTQITGNAGSVVLIGDSSTLASTDPSYGAAVIIGASNTDGTGATGFSGVHIGAGGSVQGVGVAIGNTAVVVNTTGYCGVGRLTKVTNIGQSLFGDNAQGVAGHTNAQAYGRDSRTYAANSLNFGAANVGISDFRIGAGDTQGAWGGLVWRNTNGTGNNDVVGPLSIITPLNTGTGVGGDFVISTGELAASGSTLQAATERFRILGGINGATGTAPVITVSNVGNSAAAGSLGTLANAPAAGNPTFWLRIKIGAANFAFPCWPA